VSYREVANGAQIKVFAIQLVLAALLADSSVPGRLLVLDELGNSLGDANRKDVLSALNRVATQQGVTILGTCQDSVIYDAADHCGEILWFSHASATDPYNQPTRAWGFDPEGQRVELIAPWLVEGRPPLV
jgi:ABC-type antimicrobial peptide transport system ATPase subunit